MKILKTVFVALIVFGAITVQAQKIKVTKGDLSFLKGQTAVLLEYDYSNMSVGKFDKEEDYIAKKVAEYNEAEAGKGDTWKESWFNDREARFHPMFERLLTEYTSSTGCKFAQGTDAAYKLILRTTFTEPGFNIGVARKDAMINVEITFVEVSNPESILAVMTMEKIPGRGAMGNDYDTGYRISEAYAKCGKSLGAYLTKKVFK